MWGGHAIDDARLAAWQEHSDVASSRAGAAAGYWWAWLASCSEAKRAEALQFATGSARLPSDAERKRGWRFVIEHLEDYATVAPTASNGLAAPAMLARASTCSHTIYLPPYADEAALARGMEYSLMDGGFGNA